MKYQEYFDSLNGTLCELHDDTISVSDATNQINELNQKALKSDNITLIKFLANPKEQVDRIMVARNFEAKQIENEVLVNSYDESYEESYESSY